MVKVIIMEESKSILQSKTFWVNVLVIVAGVLTAISGELQTGGTLSVIGVANIALRTITKSAITLK